MSKILHRTDVTFSLLNVRFIFQMSGSRKEEIYYSDKYYDDIYEYRHVILPKEISKKDPKDHLLSEDEWRALGIMMSVGWIHYHRHSPEPNVLLFRREHHGNRPA